MLAESNAVVSAAAIRASACQTPTISASAVRKADAADSNREASEMEHPGQFLGLRFDSDACGLVEFTRYDTLSHCEKRTDR